MEVSLGDRGLGGGRGGAQLCGSVTSRGTIYGKTCGILPAEASRGEGKRERESERERFSLCVYEPVCVYFSQADKMGYNGEGLRVSERE